MVGRPFVSASITLFVAQAFFGERSIDERIKI
jgi:hypothetical protein